MSRSFSQLSISQANNPKKRKTITRNNSHSNDQLLNLVDGHNQHGTSPNGIQKFKPHYLRVSDQIFKQLLANAISDGGKIVQCLNTNDKLQFIRQMTEITNHLQYIGLQRDLWQDYFNLGMKEGVYAPRVSKSYAKQHHTCHTYGFSKHIIEKRQQTIQDQLHRTINELQQYLIKLEEYSKQWQPSFDANILSNAINECVKKGQERLRQEFDYKRKILTLDSNDHNLITKFYQIQPNEEQVCLKGKWIEK